MFVASQFPVNGQEVFIDISGHDDEEAINRLYEEGYIEGAGNHRYNPDRVLTNAQAIQLAVNVFKLDLDTFLFVKEPLATDYFSEADNSAWYASAFIIAGANSVNIDRTIMPNEPISRKQFQQLFMLENTSENDNTMDRQKSLTRGEAANSIFKILERLKPFQSSLDTEVGANNIEFIFDIHNKTESPQVIIFNSTQIFDFDVYNSGGEHVYNWASIRNFLMIYNAVDIENDSYVRYKLPWNYKDATGEKLPAGTYTVVFTSQFMFEEEPMKLSSEVTIDIQ